VLSPLAQGGATFPSSILFLVSLVGRQVLTQFLLCLWSSLLGTCQAQLIWGVFPWLVASKELLLLARVAPASW
jgi:hypothetical protein